jgi:predicted dehydrogenase
MRSFLLLLALAAGPAAAQELKIAVVGLVHSHVWGHLSKMVKNDPARLVGVAETEKELVEQARQRGVREDLIFADYLKMLDQTKPDIVWAFVENNRHLEVAKACAARKIHLMFEKPIASTYKEAVEIQRVSEAAAIKVLVNYQMAWWPSLYAAKAQADGGKVGPVWRLRGIVGHGGPGGRTGPGRFFIEWLTDPVKNGAGALVDFGCYNALWSVWLKGRPKSVYASTLQLRPQEFPKVEDHSLMVLNYTDGAGLFEGSWDLPRSFQDLEIFGRQGSLYMKNGSLEFRAARGQAEMLEIPPLPPERAEPIRYMVEAIRNNRPIDGIVAVPINVQVVEILEAAKLSIKTGRAVALK